MVRIAVKQVLPVANFGAPIAGFKLFRPNIGSGAHSPCHFTLMVLTGIVEHSAQREECDGDHSVNNAAHVA